MASIDLDTLREMLSQAENMIAHHAGADDKAKANAALIAAGLTPQFSEFTLNWDRVQSAKYRKHAEALRYLIAYHSGEVFAGEVAA